MQGMPNHCLFSMLALRCLYSMPRQTLYCWLTASRLPAAAAASYATAADFPGQPRSYDHELLLRAD